MIRSKNSAVIIGNLVDAPQIGVANATGGERSFKIATLRVATSEEYKTQNGIQKRTEYHRVVAYRVLAEMVERVGMRKGQKVCVFGRIRSSSYTDREGIKRNSFQIESDDIFMHVRENSSYSYNEEHEVETEASDLAEMEDDTIPYK
jgi:single-strand DNA-binding protein